MSAGLPMQGPLTLQDTLQGGLTSAQDEQAAVVQALADAAARASQTAGGAQGAYQQAAAAPMPQLNPMAALIQSLGGNVASVIGETPAYRQDAQRDLSAQKDELLAKRAQNLAALKDNYDKQAAAAQSAGDLLAEAKLRKSAEQVSKAWQLIHDESANRQALTLADKNNDADMARVKEQGRNQLALQALKDKSDRAAMDEVSMQGSVVHTAPSEYFPEGGQFVDLSPFKGKQYDAANKWAMSHGIVALNAKDASAVKDVARARLDTNQFETYLQGLVPGGASERNQKYLNMKMSKLFQTDSDRAAFRTWSDIAIPILRAMAGSGGLRMSMPLIQQSIANLPKDTDTYAVFTRKIATIRTILGNSEAAFLRRDFRPSAAPTDTSKAAAMTAARKGDTAALIAIVKANPALDSDPDLEALTRKKAK
jgi:hypothetical protein